MMSEVLKIIFFLQLINFHYSLAVLQMDKSSGFDDIGTPIWKLAGCVFLVYCLLYVSLFKGVKSSGKVVWVTATGKQEKNTRNQSKILNFKQKKGSHFVQNVTPFCSKHLPETYLWLHIENLKVLKHSIPFFYHINEKFILINIIVILGHGSFTGKFFIMR